VPDPHRCGAQPDRVSSQTEAALDTPRQLNLFDWARRAMAAPTKAVNIAISKPLTLQEKHELALAKVAKFTRLAALPDLSPGEAALAQTMKRSAIAELKLSQKALDYARPHEDPEVERKLVLYRLFRLPLPPV
jgi:hypothetical protein